MKTLLMLTLVLSNICALADTQYSCEFTGPDYQLTMHDNGTITLANNFKTFICQKDYENLPGTEVELSILNCLNRKEKWRFYYGEVGDDIILSRNLALARDIICKKM